MKYKTLEDIYDYQRTWADRLKKKYDNKTDVVDDLQENLFVKRLSDLSRHEFEAGLGNELGSEEKPGHMYSLHSSSALVVNIFEWWRQNNRVNEIAKACNASYEMNQMKYEKTFPTPISGKHPPHLDVEFRDSDSNILVIESKFTEIYSERSDKKHSPRYLKTDGLWDKIPKCGVLFNQIYEEGTQKSGFVYLDVMQLLKHLLGLTYAKVNAKVNTFELLYLWYDFQSSESKKHRDEVKDFEARIDGDIRFRAMTHDELFAEIRKISGIDKGYEYYLFGRYFSNEWLLARENESWKPVNPESSGVLAYKPLMDRLEKINSPEGRRQKASESLPMALLCAIQDSKCLNDIRNVANQYPHLIPEIVIADHDLRLNSKYHEWMDYETKDYKSFITQMQSRFLENITIQ